MNVAGKQALAEHSAPVAGNTPESSTPFRFYDNRQKYLAFVNTCNEKSAIARRAAQELAHVKPTSAGAAVLRRGHGRRHRAVAPHAQHPPGVSTVPLMAVAKEISLEDVRSGLEKMPDRFYEHPATVLVVTNLNYAEAPRLMPRDMSSAAALNWQEVRLTGDSSHEYAEQIEELERTLDYGWQTKPSPRSGNPVYARPSVLVIYREDQKFLLDSIIPKPGRIFESYDLILASQPWRARMSAEFKAQKVLAPLARSLAPGRPAARDSVVRPRSGAGDHPEAVAGRESVPGRPPRAAGGAEDRARPRCARFHLTALPDEKAVFRYDMHTLPSEIADRIGTSTLYRGLERRHLRQPDRGRAPRLRHAERRVPERHADGPAETQRTVVQRRNLRRGPPQALSESHFMNANQRNAVSPRA